MPVLIFERLNYGFRAGQQYVESDGTTASRAGIRS